MQTRARGTLSLSAGTGNHPRGTKCCRHGRKLLKEVERMSLVGVLGIKPCASSLDSIFATWAWIPPLDRVAVCILLLIARGWGYDAFLDFMDLRYCNITVLQRLFPDPSLSIDEVAALRYDAVDQSIWR